MIDFSQILLQQCTSASPFSFSLALSLSNFFFVLGQFLYRSPFYLSFCPARKTLPWDGSLTCEGPTFLWRRR